MSYDIKYRRMSDETEDDYCWRVCLNKDLGVYSELTWEDVGDILNSELDENFTSSKWRKNYQMMKKGFDKARQENIEDEEILEDIELKKLELYKQQVKTRDQIREYRKHIRNEARIDNLKDVFLECANEISESNPLIIEKYPNAQGERVAILSLSDLHYGELVDDFLNTYNVDIFHKRMAKIVNKTINYCKLMKVDTLKVLNLGDWSSGNIHVSTRVLSEQDVVEQTMAVAEVASEMLTEFAREINKVEFCSVTDNHSRINKNVKEHIEKESFSRFIPWFIKERVKNINNIVVVENKINDIEEFEIGVFDIFHEKAFFVHGHHDRVGTVIPDLTLMTKIFPISVFIGHLHKNYEDEVHGIDLIMNPSGIGSGEYSKSIRKTSRPRQKLTVYENNDGNVERVSTFFINL